MLKSNLFRNLCLLAVSAAGTHTVYSQCAPDLTPPIITCPSNIIQNNDPGTCTSTVTFSDPLTSDNCPVLQSQTFNYTGAMQTYTVPAGVTTITIETWGAQGQGGNGGMGGYVKGDLTVTPGQVYNVFVGGQNGYNGGGLGHAATAKNGGGASDVRFGGITLADRIIVAGGGGAGGPTDVGNHQGGAGGGGTAGANYAGGGGGAGYGGAGTVGGITGGAGNNTCHSGGAGGGGFTSGGLASCNTCYTSTCGQDGSLGLGGNGDTWENGICYSSYNGTAGGGGGYYGGGGTSVGNCGSGAGGGGSSWSGALTSQVLTGGLKAGDGQIVISYLEAVVTTTQLAGLTSGSSFPVGTTTQTFQAEDASGNLATCSFDITIVNTIDVTTTVSNVTTITANNSSATSYQWIDCDNANAPIAGETNQSFVASTDGNYAVIVDEAGCPDTSACVAILGAGISSNQLTNVKVYPSPTTGNYTIELGQVYETVLVKVTDAGGRVVEQYAANSTSKINSTFTGSKGIYLIQIIADSKQMTTTLIVE